MTGGGEKLNGRCDMLEKRFTTLWIMQLGEKITIHNTPTLFHQSKAINTPLLIGLSILDVW